MSADYWALAVSVDAEATDAVANFLTEAGAAGIVEEGNGRPRRLRAFFPPGTDPEKTAGGLRAYLEALRALDVAVGTGGVEVAPILPEAWAEAWRAHFRPLPVGRRLLVCPPWDVPAGAEETRLVVLIEPGRAFGTGSHGSTRGCLELLERALGAVPAGRVLDVGTGSGILGIAAARLGAPLVTALDLDPDAIAAARANAARNGVAARVRVELGTPEAWSGPPADLVLANLLGRALLALAPALGRCTSPGGRLIAGGLLVTETPAVAAAFAREGFGLAEQAEHEEWASLLLRRPGARAV